MTNNNKKNNQDGKHSNTFMLPNNHYMIYAENKPAFRKQQYIKY